MKYLITFISCFCFINAVKAQSNEDAIKFIRGVIPFKHIVYVDSANVYSIEMRELLDKDTIHTLMAAVPNFVITKDERKHISEELNAMQSFVWSEGLIDSSRMIRKDTLNRLLNTTNRSKGWKYIRSHYGNDIYYFSKPIFLRNSTICIFYMNNYCDWTNCGNGALIIYEKENNKWVSEYMLAAWQM